MAGRLLSSSYSLVATANRFLQFDVVAIRNSVAPVAGIPQIELLRRELTAIPRDPGGVEGGSTEALRPTGMTSGASISEVSDILSIVSLVKAFRDRGHYVAKLDPLGRSLGPLLDNSQPPSLPSSPSLSSSTSSFSSSSLSSSSPPPSATNPPVNAPDLFLLLKDYPRLNLEAVGLKGLNPKRKYFLGAQLRIVKATQLFWTVEEVVAVLRNAYCGSSTVECSHLSSKAQKQWVQEAMERPLLRSLLTEEQQRGLLRRLMYADSFERFLGLKFPSSKRFGMEGGESLLPGMHALLSRAAETGIKYVELGMAHRGRLSVLHCLLGKPLSSVLSEFRAPAVSEDISQLLHVGDVKYHLGTRSTLEFGGKELQVSLLPNPSHLELVDPVVVGKTRAKQTFTPGATKQTAMGLLLHGDAAFSGQGLAPEVLQLSDLPDYTTGGTIHIIINNQIGFTTDPRVARSSPHPSDFAKAVGAPIFHVNADDAEAVAHVCSLAVDWRQKFGKDVVVDFVCYRRQGHNEQDDPRVTQPLMYSLIHSHQTCLELYAQRLIAEGVTTQQGVDSLQHQISCDFESAFAESSKHQPTGHEWLASNWQGEALGSLVQQRKVLPTGLPAATLHRVGNAMCSVPDDIELHPLVSSLLASRRKMLETGAGIDWAAAEALAFGSLLLPPDESLQQTPESNPAHAVRLSGQDSERGTFNQRHAVIHCQRTDRRYIPLAHLSAQQERFMVCNSSLSEAAVLGFEYGFSLENENALVLWEAQFGDFSNNAQAIIDNCICCGEDKWMTPTGLVLLLPHGYDGQGPEHSSARVERFLQLVNDDADHLHGWGPTFEAQVDAGFAAADRDKKGFVSLSDLQGFMAAQHSLSPHQVAALAHQLHIDGNETISRSDWHAFMRRWMRRNAQRENNLCVVNLTTPANYFHALRRQVNRHFAKPMVVMAPKSLLHHRACTSNLSDFVSGTFFHPIIADNDVADNLRVSHCSSLNPPSEMRRLLLCSGKIYYMLAHARKSRRIADIGLVRIEQLAPLVADQLAAVINGHSGAELVWVQEEPKNMGAWSYISPRIATLLRTLCPSHPAASATPPHGTAIRFVGRPPSASTATGSFSIHQAQAKAILEEALG